jgi:hypothetical protein
MSDASKSANANKELARFKKTATQVISVSKKEIERREKEWREERKAVQSNGVLRRLPRP